MDRLTELSSRVESKIIAALREVVGDLPENVEIKKAFEFSNNIILLCTGNIGSLIGREGNTIKELSKKLSKNVKIVEQNTEKLMIQQLLGNTRVVAVTKSTKIENQKLTSQLKIYLNEQDAQKHNVDIQAVQQAVMEMVGSEATISFG